MSFSETGPEVLTGRPSPEPWVPSGPSARHDPRNELRVERYCPGCEVYWTGGRHCWSCGREGERRESYVGEIAPGNFEDFDREDISLEDFGDVCYDYG